MCKIWIWFAHLFIGKTRGKSPNQSFKMSLTVLLLDISGNFLNNKVSVSCNIEMNIFVVTASGRTKKLAKHNCAFNIMVEIKKRKQEGVDFELVWNDKVVACCEWLVSSIFFFLVF